MRIYAPLNRSVRFFAVVVHVVYLTLVSYAGLAAGLEGFHLQKGHYVALRPEADGWFWVRSLGLFLGVSDGWGTVAHAGGRDFGKTGRESACAERAKAEAERVKADVERLRAEAAEKELLALREELRRLQS